MEAAYQIEFTCVSNFTFSALYEKAALPKQPVQLILNQAKAHRSSFELSL